MKQLQQNTICCDSEHCKKNKICSLHTSYELEMEETGDFRDFEPVLSEKREGYIVSAYCDSFDILPGVYTEVSV